MWRILLLAVTVPLAASPPVVFTSSHIGSFSALARWLPSDATLTLVLVDAHDDAMALTESRTIRARLWEDGVVQESVLRTLDAGQYIEGYNWIEPLMPHPLARVLWIAPASSLADQARTRVIAALNTEVRAAGEPDLEVNFKEGPPDQVPDGPWVLSIDLDYFAESPGALEGNLRTLLGLCRRNPPLVVTFAVSEPYLASASQGELFVTIAWSVLLEETDWRITVDPRVSWGGRDRGQEHRLAARQRVWEEFNFTRVRPWADQYGQGRITYATEDRR